MRDANRLDDFYDKIKEIHKKEFPDWRFGQFIINFCGYYGDPFYLEEDKFIEKLENYVKVMKGRD